MTKNQLYIANSYIPYVRNYYSRFLLFFHFIICRLFFDDWRYSFEKVWLLNKSGYYQRAINNCASTVNRILGRYRILRRQNCVVFCTPKMFVSNITIFIDSASKARFVTIFSGGISNMQYNVFVAKRARAFVRSDI